MMIQPRFCAQHANIAANIAPQVLAGSTMHRNKPTTRVFTKTPLKNSPIQRDAYTKTTYPATASPPQPPQPHQVRSVRVRFVMCFVNCSCPCAGDGHLYLFTCLVSLVSWHAHPRARCIVLCALYSFVRTIVPSSYPTLLIHPGPHRQHHGQRGLHLCSRRGMRWWLQMRC